jgi:ribosomal silencing factor RsfS
MKLDLNAKAEAVVAADEEATAEVMVVEAVAGAAVMAEAAVVAVGEGAVAMAVVADAIVNSSRRVC